jgi:hypothetical protein
MGIMGNQNQHKSKKRQKEFERMRKAKEKMARRQGKKDKKAGAGAAGIPDQPYQSINSRDINNLLSFLRRTGQELQPGSDQKKGV